MRKLRLFILLGLFISSCQFTTAQVFGHSGATWVFHSPATWGMCSEWYEIWEYDGDTTVFGVNSKNVRVTTKMQFIVPPNPWVTSHYNRYFHVSGDTVSVFNPNDTTWTELYNFSVSVGDSVPSPMDNFLNDMSEYCQDSLPYNSNAVVTATGTTVIDGQNLRYYTVQYINSDNGSTASVTYYERLITQGYWYPSPYVCNISDWCDPPGLMCYKDDGMMTDTSCTNINWIETLSIPQESAQTSGISIYPNPTSNVLTVQHDPNPLEKYSIIGSDGKVILTNIQSPINTSNLPSGVYFITNEGRTWYKKFIKS